MVVIWVADMSVTKLEVYVVCGGHQSSVTLARSTRLHSAPIASTAVSRPTSEPEDFLRPKTLAAKTVAPLGAHMLLCQARLQTHTIAACWDVCNLVIYFLI